MVEDISSKTIVVLVVLTVLVSLLSTLVVVNEVLNLKAGSGGGQNTVAPQGPAQGKVSLEITRSPEPPATGLVVMEIR